MLWRRLAVLLVSLAVGISVPIGLTKMPITGDTTVVRAASVDYSGTLGTCTWQLTADGKTLTIDGGSGGVLPEGGPGAGGGRRDGIIQQSICDQLQVSGASYDIAKLRNLETVNLTGKIKTGKSAERLFADFPANSIQEITLNGLDNIDTSDTVNMAGMFNNTRFKSLDLSKFNTKSVTDMSNMFTSSWFLTTLDLSSFDTENVTNMAGMFSTCPGMQTLDLSSFNTGKVTDMSGMFLDDSTLQVLNLSSFNTENVATMESMFAGLSGLSQSNSLVFGDEFDTHNVTDMAQMFLGAGLPTLDLEKFDTSNVTDMSSMFSSMHNLTQIDVSKLSTSKVILMAYMFSSEDNLESIKFGGKFDSSHVQSMWGMFSDTEKLNNLDLSELDTRSVTNMHAMFQRATGLVTQDLSTFDTSKVTDFSVMFDGDTNLQNVNVSSFDTGSGIDFNQMFQKCTGLKQLNLSNFDTANAVRSDDKGDTTFGLSQMFNGDTSLTSLDISGFTMTDNRVSGEYTVTDNMFSENSQLSRLVLGPKVRFVKISEYSSGPQLPNITANELYTGKWEAVGAGTEENPKGKTYATSDDLINAYMGDARPTGKQIYVWEPVKRPVTPPSPSLPGTGTETPTRNPIPDEVFKGSSLDAIKKIGLYRRPTFTKRNRITWYTKAPRTRQPQFVVIGKGTSKHGVARYQVRDVNHHSKTYRLTGYVTTRSEYVTPTYLPQISSKNVITVINPQGVNGYQQANLTQKRKHYRQGQQLKVKRIVTHNLTTRFQLTNGQYVTANRQWVQNGQRRYPRKITAKRTIWRYHDVNFKTATHHYRRHQQLKVRGWDYSDHGTLRYRVAGGYVTANARFIK